MKKLILQLMVLTGLLSFFACNNTSDPSAWSKEKTDKWFEKGEWLNGWSVKPDASVNRKEFAIAYFNNKDRWDKAFTFLKNSDLNGLGVLRVDIDGDNLFAAPSEYLTKDRDSANFEAHRKYIDIQYVVSGEEMIGVAPLTSKNEELIPYDAEKDIEFMKVSGDKEYEAKPDRFFIFFPSDAHRPSLKVNENSQVKKIVIKVKVD